MAEWSGIVNTTTQKYLKGASDATIRKRLLLAMMKKKGRMTFNNDGRFVQWQIEHKEHTMQSFGYGSPLDFSPTDRFTIAQIEYRGYKVTDMMDEKETLMNRGVPALINRYDRTLKDMTKNMENRFPTEMYVDGYASGNENRLCGFNSFTGTGTTVAADRIAQPSDTYATLSTVLGTKGGTWSTGLSTSPNANVATDWPDGQGSSEYDYHSPKILNWSSTGWGTGSTTWEDNCERVIGQSVFWTLVPGGQAGRLDALLLAPNLMAAHQNHMRSRSRITVPHKEANDLGFPGALNQDGIALDYDFDVPVNEGYGWNVDEIELMCMYGQMFMPRGPDFEPRTQTYLFAIGFFGNMKFGNLKAMCKIDNVA